jgi:hypothetical protein
MLHWQLLESSLLELLLVLLKVHRWLVAHFLVLF